MQGKGPTTQNSSVYVTLHKEYQSPVRTCLFKASKVSSLMSLLAVMTRFPNPGASNSFSIARKIRRASTEKYDKSPESNLIPRALYLHMNRSHLKKKSLKVRTEQETSSNLKHGPTVLN